MGNEENIDLKNNFDTIFDKKMNLIKNELEIKLEVIKKDLLQYLEKNVKDVILKDIKQFYESHKNSNDSKGNTVKEKEVHKVDNMPKNVDSKDDYKNTKTSDFIKKCKKNDLNYEFYEVKEIDEENENIISQINDKVYENYLPEKENIINETAGKFFYSVGGISRISQTIANKAFYELFEEYKKFLKDNEEWLTFNHEEDRKKFSIWTKKCLKEKEYFNYFSQKNFSEIKKYLSNDEKSNIIFQKLYKKLIGLYMKCRLSFPIIKADYLNNNCEFIPKSMVDCFLKYERNKKVNFCYFPGLISNGQLTRNGKYYVFTYSKGKTYYMDGIIYENKIEEQMPKLYAIPDPKNFEIKISQEKYGELLIKTIPEICQDLKPNYLLIKSINSKEKLIEQNETGIFQNIGASFYYIKVTYANKQEKKTPNFRMKK